MKPFDQAMEFKDPLPYILTEKALTHFPILVLADNCTIGIDMLQ